MSDFEYSVEITDESDSVVEIVDDADSVIEIVSEGLQGPPGAGVPLDGVAGQYLVKQSNIPNDTRWAYFPYVLLQQGESVNPDTTPFGALVVQMTD